MSDMKNNFFCHNFSYFVDDLLLRTILSFLLLFAFYFLCKMRNECEMRIWTERLDMKFEEEGFAC